MLDTHCTPVRNRSRIYNAVTLELKHVKLVRHMEHVGRACVRAMLKADGRTEQGTVLPIASVPSTLANRSMTLPPLKPINVLQTSIGRRIIVMIAWHAVSAHDTSLFQ